ncbi:hypothetical protein, partial [Yersinia frederiksenii]|uniref:hypothetical protein n=1 Tax=Yersinia frederiksenii TaxID=29484 RepID=UPI001C93EC30
VESLRGSELWNFLSKDCIPQREAGKIPLHHNVASAARTNGAYLHKSIDKRRLKGHIPRPLNCPQ